MSRHRSSSFAFSATLLLLGGALFATRLAARRAPEYPAVPLTEISRDLGGWRSSGDNELDEGTLHALAASSSLSRTYRRGSRQLELFVAYYAMQRAGESMHSPKHCLPGGGWEIWGQDSASISVRGQVVRINKYAIQNQGFRRLILYWYQSRNRIIASEYLGKVLLVKDTLIEGNTAGAIVRITMPDDPESAEEGPAFASDIVTEVQRCFGVSLPSHLKSASPR